MTFWIVAAGLTGLTCLALLQALGRQTAVADDHDRAFYDAQLIEIERQKKLGLIGEVEAESARVEAARRLLKAQTPDASTVGSGDTSGKRIGALVVLVLVPLIVLPLYLTRGAPGMPSFPLAARKADPAVAAQSLDVGNALSQIEAHLAKNPDDGRGFEVIAPVYMRMGRHADSIKAYTETLRLLGPSAERHAGLGEARVFAANGTVSKEAAADFEAALALDAKHVKARFFLALAADQNGDKPRAVSLLTGLRDDLPDGALKSEIVAQLNAMQAVPEGGAAIAALPQGEQAAVIRSMVEGLAQRLATTGGSAEEWARLIRALNVLGEKERAALILAEARQKFAADPEQLRLVEEFGKAQP
ncbi:MAG: c-type cytochrome biogenesis protein CcmI [Beijerinckiaceae bacterium]